MTITINQPTKHAGFILSVKADALINDIVKNLYKKYDHVEDFLYSDGTSSQLIEIKDEAHFWNFLQENLFIAQRAQLEKNFEFRQLLPYCMVTQDMDSPLGFGVLTYARLQGGGESKLHGKSSIGFGGHVDISDIQYADPTNTVPDIYLTITENVYREVKKEELTIKRPLDKMIEGSGIPKFTKYILLETDDITGRVHLGLVYRLHIPADATITSDETAQIELTGVTSFSQAQLSGRNWEGWSHALVDFFAALEKREVSLSIEQANEFYEASKMPSEDRDRLAKTIATILPEHLSEVLADIQASRVLQADIPDSFAAFTSEDTTPAGEQDKMTPVSKEVSQERNPERLNNESDLPTGHGGRGGYSD